MTPVSQGSFAPWGKKRGKCCRLHKRRGKREGGRTQRRNKGKSRTRNLRSNASPRQERGKAEHRGCCTERKEGQKEVKEAMKCQFSSSGCKEKARGAGSRRLREKKNLKPLDDKICIKGEKRKLRRKTNVSLVEWKTGKYRRILRNMTQPPGKG